MHYEIWNLCHKILILWHILIKLGNFMAHIYKIVEIWPIFHNFWPLNVNHRNRTFCPYKPLLKPIYCKNFVKIRIWERGEKVVTHSLTHSLIHSLKYPLVKGDDAPQNPSILLTTISYRGKLELNSKLGPLQLFSKQVKILPFYWGKEVWGTFHNLGPFCVRVFKLWEPISRLILHAEH